MTTFLLLFAPLPLGVGVKVVWLVCLATIVGAAVAGRPEERAGRRRLAAVLGTLATLYVGAMVAADLVARAAVRSAAEVAGLEVRDLVVSPDPANPFTAEVEVLTPDGFVPGRRDWLASPSVELFPDRVTPLLQAPEGMPQAELDRVLSAARQVPDVHYWLEWARYPHVRVEPEGDGWRVSWGDVRYNEVDTGELSGISVVVQ